MIVDEIYYMREQINLLRHNILLLNVQLDEIEDTLNRVDNDYDTEKQVEEE
jgi:hypothetical protein